MPEVTITATLTTISGGCDRRLMKLRVQDEASALIILDADLDADQVFDLINGRITGDDPVQARILHPEAFARVGKKRHHFARKLGGYGMSEDQAMDIANQIGAKIGADASDTNRRQGGRFGSWTIWTNDLTDEDRVHVQRIIDDHPIPETSR
jgi:hypothetical protein